MKKVQIITDSCSDLSAELLERYGIDYAKMMTVTDGKESPALLTWTKDEAHSLYETMRGGTRITTTQVPPEEFIRIFTKHLDAGMDVVYIGCSLKQSGSVNTAAAVAKKILADRTESKIICIDSQNASLGEGMLAIEAAKMANDGLGAEEIEKEILKIRKTVNEYVTVHSLKTLYKAGRVKGPAAFFGNLLGVKPIIISDADGEQAAYKKVKGRRASFEEIANLLKESIVNPEEQTVYVVHADCQDEEVKELADIVRAAIPCKDVHVGIIGPIIGASIGPDAVGVFAFGRTVEFRIGDE
ncbi:MAG: DegV family protein [Clostridia bacterium]|nr:DegV family protein [Clostridia bacterium]